MRETQTLKAVLPAIETLLKSDSKSPILLSNFIHPFSSIILREIMAKFVCESSRNPQHKVTVSQQ